MKFKIPLFLKKYLYEIILTSIVLACTSLFILKNKSITSLGFPFDDSWIHAKFAKNLVATGTFSFNPPTASLGTSSLSWVFLLTIFSLFFRNIVFTGLFMGIVSTLLLVIGVYKLSQFIFQEKSGNFPFWSTFLFSTIGVLYFHELSGLESTMFLAVGMWSIVFFCRKNYLLSSLLAGLLVLTRIEGIILLGLLILTSIFQKGQKQNIAKIILPGLIIISGNLVFNFIISKSFLPSTFAGKQWLFLNNNTYFSLQKNILDFWLYWINFILSSLLLNKQPQALLSLPYFSFLLIGLFKFIQRTYNYIFRKSKETASFLLSSWFLAHNLAYQILLPWIGNAGRYQFINILVFTVFFVAGIEFTFSIAKKTVLKTLIKILPLSVYLLINIYSLVFWSQTYALATHHINSTHKEAGIFISNNLDKKATIAAFDIGAISYFSENKILDLGCLTEKNNCIEYLKNNRIPALILEKKPDYLAMPESPDYQDFLNLYKDPFFDSRITKTLIKSFDVNYYQDYLFTYNAFPRLSIYKLNYE